MSHIDFNLKLKLNKFNHSETQVIINDLREILDNSQTGYVKEWKLHSLMMTYNMLGEKGAVRDLNDIFDQCYSTMNMEGIDSPTITKCAEYLYTAFYNNR